MTLNGLFCAGLMAATVTTSPALALEWTVVDISPFSHLALSPPTDPRYPRVDTAPRGIKVYIGRGDIEAGDAERLAALYHSAEGGDSGAASNPLLGPSFNAARYRDAFPEVWLDSPGGDPFEGFRIGQVIRDLRLATVVPEGAYCASACTMAFLGGVERRIEGPYLIHSASPDEGVEADEVLETVQVFSAVYVLYARSMIGDSTVAEAAIAFGTGGEKHQALQLDDAQLRDWGVITVAARPSQSYPPQSLNTIDCGSETPPTVAAVMCNDLPLGRYDARMSAALTAMDGTTMAALMLAQQSRWQAVRDACETKSPYYARTLQGTNTEGPSYEVQACLLEVYDARVRQLEAAVAYGEASDIARRAGWN